MKVIDPGHAYALDCGLPIAFLKKLPGERGQGHAVGG